MATVAQMAIALNARVSGFVTGMRKATGSMGKFQKKAKKTNFITKGFNRSLVQLGKIAGAVAVGRGLFRTAAAAENFNRAFLQSTAIMGDLDDAMKQTLRETALQVSRVTIFTSEQVAKSFFFLASAGLDAAQSIRAMPIVSKFAQAGMFEMSLATDLLTDAQSALGLTVKDTEQNMANMTRVGNTLVRANQLANASVQEFAEALGFKAASKMKAWNIKLNEGVAVLAAFADQMVKGREGGTAFDVFIAELTKRARENAAAFRQMKIRVFEFGQLRTPALIIKDMEQAFANLTPQMRSARLAMLGFERRGVTMIQKLLGASAKMERYAENMKDVGGAMDEVANKSVTPLQLALADLGAAWVRLGQDASPIIDVFAAGIKNLAGLVRTFSLAAFAIRGGPPPVPASALVPAPINTSVPGVATTGGRRTQRVLDPQVGETNQILRSMDRKLGPARAG